MAITVVGLSCPIDALPLASLAADTKSDTDKKAIGDHQHLSVLQSASCLNGHTWRLSGELILERTK